MQSYMMYASLLGSAFSTLATLYFWLVRMRAERPNLKPHLLDHEFFLGASRNQVRQIGVKLGVIMANYSVLPNAVLGARASIRLRDGWTEVGQLAFDKQTPQPFNIPPMQTVLLRLTGVLSFPYHPELEDGSRTVANYLGHSVGPLEAKLEVQRLNDQTDTHLLALPVCAEVQEHTPSGKLAYATT